MLAYSTASSSNDVSSIQAETHLEDENVLMNVHKPGLRRSDIINNTLPDLPIEPAKEVFARRCARQAAPSVRSVSAASTVSLSSMDLHLVSEALYILFDLKSGYWKRCAIPECYSLQSP